MTHTLNRIPLAREPSREASQSPGARPSPAPSMIPATVAIPTVPAFLDKSFNTYRNSHCVSVRELGHWRWQSSEDLSGEIRRLALALHRQGVGQGSRVAIVGDPSPAWLAADLAVMSLGAVSVPLFPTMSAEHFRYAVEHTATRILIVIGSAGWQLAQHAIGLFRCVVVRGVALPASHRVHPWHEMLALGDTVSYEDPALFHRLLQRTKPDDLATIIHTSGSTGMPKGVELTHRNLVSQIQGACTLFPLVAGRDTALSCLPLAHVFERVVVYVYLVQGVPVQFADDVKQVGALLREVRPAVMTAVPRLIEKLHARIRTQIAESVAIKRQLGKWAIELATTQGPTMREKRGGHPWALRVADRLIYAKLRQALGGQLKYLIVGGAALSDELQRFLVGVDLPVYTGYGLTEASPVIAVNHPGARRLGTVGKLFPGVEVRFTPQGEILARGPGIMRGYHNSTESPIDSDGWLHTGDLGSFDADGYLRITGRVKELYKTANGKYVAPTPIEQALVAGAQDSGGLVDQALIVAEGQPCVGVLLFPDADGLRRRKQALGLSEVTDRDFLARPEISGDLARVVERVNAGLSSWERIRCWRFVPEAPSVENEGLTPTMKLRRSVLTRRYERLIADMYATRPTAGEGGDHG